jgi:hypothetical protein
MHDASEAYLSDISRGVKMLMHEYKDWERELEKVIALRFNLPFPHPPDVKIADTEILRREGAWLFPEGSPMWHAWGITSRDDYPAIERLTPDQAKVRFIERYYQLGGLAK